LRYVGDDGVRLHGYSDSNLVGSAVDRKSTSGGCFILGSIVVSWYSRKKTSMELSLVEEEYMVVHLASCEAIWLHKLLAGFFG
jgi:hypothetical protein